MNSTYPLTPFEEYMLHDDSVEHPMVFFIRADLEGELEATKFQSAFDEVVRRHPILWSRLVNQGQTDLLWQPDRGRIPRLYFGNGEPTGQCPLKAHIDLDSEAGLRAFVKLGSQSSELWLQFHHSCCDGIAGIALLNELVVAYERHASHVISPSADFSEVFPTKRSSFLSLTRGEKIRRLWRDVTRTWHFVSRRSVSTAVTVEAPAAVSDVPHYLEAQLEFDPSVRERLKRIHPASTVNDVLVRDVYLALRESICEHQPMGNRDWMRVAVATNLRERGAPVIDCRNDVSMVFLDRRMGRPPCKTELLRSISHEMTQVKSDRMGYTMLRALNWLRYLPGGIGPAIALLRPQAATVVSNLGAVNMYRAEGFTIKKLAFLVPIHERAPISFGAVTFGDQLTLCLHYDPQLIGRPRAEKLLSVLVGLLAESMPEEDGTSVQPEIRRAA